jgi:hypothetical protein
VREEERGDVEGVKGEMDISTSNSPCRTTYSERAQALRPKMIFPEPENGSILFALYPFCVSQDDPDDGCFVYNIETCIYYFFLLLSCF